MINNARRNTLILVAIALFLRIFNFSFPAFTTDEAVVAFRGYLLSERGVDELGRKFPFLFNSLNDYQLPIVSYISAVGTKFLDKSELGARLPLIIIGLASVSLTYKVASQIIKEKNFAFLSALIVATSPVLIFVSKTPNESIVLATLFLLLFYLLNKDRANFILIILTIVLLILTSKLAWFILAPFVIYTVFIYRNTFNLKDKLKLSVISLIFVTLAFAFFLQIPQAKRSLSENNLSLFSDITIKNGINKIRGQGLMSKWPPILEQVLINKLFYIVVEGSQWLSNIQPAVLFSQFDKSGNLGFVGMGAFPKAAIVPAVLGIIFLIKEKRSKILLYPLILTFPTGLIFPKLSPEIVVLVIPFVGFLIAFGFLYLKKLFASIVVVVMIVELMINLIFLSPQIKFTNDKRPYWIKSIVKDGYNLSNTSKVLISDNVTENLTPLIFWYTDLNSKEAFLNIPYPYKVRQTNLGSIKVVGASDSIRNCVQDEDARFFASSRDLERIKDLGDVEIESTYLNSRGDVITYFIKNKVCIN